MGLFGGSKKIQINVPPPPKLPTAEELFQAATTNAQSTAPQAFGARESALSDLATPESTQAYFNAFQPTSFEQALGNQYFQNVLPDVEKSILHNLSLSGVANSPIAARLIGRETGKVGYDVGSFLANQANNRALASLNYRNIDPFSMINPFVKAGIQQSQAQADLTQQYNDLQTQIALANAIKEQQPSGFGRFLGGALGGIGGFLRGGPAGALTGFGIGSGIGGLASGDFGVGDALGIYGGLNNFDKLGFGRRSVSSGAPSSYNLFQDPKLQGSLQDILGEPDFVFQ